MNEQYGHAAEGCGEVVRTATVNSSAGCRLSRRWIEPLDGLRSRYEGEIDTHIPSGGQEYQIVGTRQCVAGRDEVSTRSIVGQVHS
jgi:hypothetical protein